ncbi:hypothetical protein IWW38_002899 [Coemansia aciculifera]|uniref:Uncharacterized protein n=1 Tax=Coemansia aciculifera TaxID=417176 RepID=A0ACC1M277_9FUNG|nr:hypothetical protein IWW38_002899 [Coemansia aciculifera]
MRSFIILALLSLLVALALATTKIDPATDYVSLSQPEYTKATKEPYKKYTASKAGACINVHKAFSKSNTFIFTHGRRVELYNKPNCQSKFKTTTSNKLALEIHGIASFRVESK